jgi:hypothetical protein
MAYSNKVVLTLEDYEAMRDRNKELDGMVKILDVKLKESEEMIIRTNLIGYRFASGNLNDLLNLDDCWKTGLSNVDEMRKLGISDDTMKDFITMEFERRNKK